MLERKKIDQSRLPPTVTEKWRADVLDEGFVPFPKRLIRCLPRVLGDLDDLRVVLAIVDYRRPNLMRPPSVEYLAFVAGMGLEEFAGRADDLCRRGLLSYEGTPESVTFDIKGLLQKILEATPE